MLGYRQQRVLLLRLLGGVDYQARREARVCVQVFDRVGAGVDVCVDVDICVGVCVGILPFIFSSSLATNEEKESLASPGDTAKTSARQSNT